MADCDRRNSAYCNKRYGRPATRCDLVVEMVVKSVGAHAINRRARRIIMRVARQCNAVLLQSRYCCRCDETCKENDMRSVDESSSWRRLQTCVRWWDCGTESERESQHVADDPCPYQPFLAVSLHLPETRATRDS
jgi:hypothetical protein